MAYDDKPLYAIRRDFSGGINSRMHGTNILDNQVTNLINVDIGVPGQRSKRPGSVQVGAALGSDSIIGLHNYVIQGDVDQLLAYSGTTLSKWTGGSWSSIKGDFATATEVGFC